MCAKVGCGGSSTSRLQQDYVRLKRDPIPFVTAEPLPSNLLEWHYVIQGPLGSPYHGGYYHGKLVFPREFPFKPPSIYMLTPNGRFKTNTRLCLSISDFHPDTWNPAWSVSTILTGLLSFMLESQPTLGSIETSDHEKIKLAISSGQFNMKNRTFCDLFPDITEEIVALEKERLQRCQTKAGSRSRRKDSSTAGKPKPLINRLINTALSNLTLVSAVIAFAYGVHYIVTSLS